MKRTMVRYRVRAGRAEENARYLAAVFEALHGAAPAGVRYASFRLDDGVSFVHLFSHDDGVAWTLRELPEFQAFTADIRSRCDEPPVTASLTEIGSYQFP